MSKLYAFWPYDLYPRCLGAEVEKVEDNNTYTVKAYGRMRLTEKVVLVPLNVGKTLHKELETLAAEREKRLAELEAQFEAKRLDAFKRAGVRPPGK